jgi:hypothetical protein
MSDVQATHDFNQKLKEAKCRANWDTIVVIEEFSVYERSYEH